MENNKQTAKGNGWALLPIEIFLVVYIGAGIIFQDFYTLSVVVAFMIAILVACMQNRKLKFEDKLSGNADFSSSLSFAVGDYTNAIKSLNGKIDFHSTNGKMGTLGKFEYYLYAQNILYHGLLNTTLNRIADALTKDNTSHYRFADGSVLFQNGYMITNSIKTTGNDMSLYVTGRHNLLTNQVNIDIYGRISDEIKNKLGSFGDVSISNFLSSQNEKKSNNVMLVNKSIIDRIPDLYAKNNQKTNTFKVNLYGDINSLNVINSFMWLLPKENVVEQEKLPDFSDMVQNL